MKKCIRHADCTSSGHQSGSPGVRFITAPQRPLLAGSSKCPITMCCNKKKILCNIIQDSKLNGKTCLEVFDYLVKHCCNISCINGFQTKDRFLVIFLSESLLQRKPATQWMLNGALELNRTQHASAFTFSQTCLYRGLFT